jgi:uncharacterized protein
MIGQGRHLKIRIADITEKAKPLEAVDNVAFYPSLIQAQDAGECQFLAPVTVLFSVAREFDHIRVQGNVGTTVRLTCSRCLSEFTSELSSNFTVFYTKADTAQPEDEVELAEQDLISATYSGDEIDFSDEVAEQILLEIPYKPLCSEACNGLCASCGTDLNISDCTCKNSAVSMAFSSLQGLKVIH